MGAATLAAMPGPQDEIDNANAGFWDELCGTTLAQQIGVTDASPESLARFDEAYLGHYPYLRGYLPSLAAPRERLLEVGLGYGTVSQILAERGFDYNGLDIAEGPAQMVRARISRLGFEDSVDRVKIGSILEAPYPDEVFDRVVAIGCLHHTGDMQRGVDEVHRILKPGGEATVMVYHHRSYRRFKQALARLRGRGLDDEEVRASYDHDSEGAPAPATEYAGRLEAKRGLFGVFSEVRTRTENFDYMVRKGKPVSREFLLGWPARLAGLDLYITAIK